MFEEFMERFASSKNNNNFFDTMTAYFIEKRGDKEKLHDRWEGQLKTYFILMKTLELLSTIDDFSGIQAALEHFIQLGRKLHNPNTNFMEQFLDTNYFSDYYQTLKAMQVMPENDLKQAFRAQQQLKKIYELFTTHALDQENLQSIGLWSIISFFPEETLRAVLQHPQIPQNILTISGDMLILAAKLNDIGKLEILLTTITSEINQDLNTLYKLLLFQESQPPCNTILHYAVFHKNLLMVYKILNTAGQQNIAFELIKIQNIDGNTALHLAAYAPFERNQRLIKLDTVVDEKSEEIIFEKNPNFETIHADLLSINKSWFESIAKINQAIITACQRTELPELFLLQNIQKATFLHVAAQFHEDFITYFTFIASYLSTTDLNKLCRQRAYLHDREQFGFEKPSHSGKTEAAIVSVYAIFFSLLSVGIAAAPFLVYGSAKVSNYVYNTKTNHSLRGTMAWHYNSKWPHVAEKKIRIFDDIIASYNCFNNIKALLDKERQQISQRSKSKHSSSEYELLPIRNYSSCKFHFENIFLPTILYIFGHENERDTLISRYKDKKPFSAQEIQALNLPTDYNQRDSEDAIVKIYFFPQIPKSSSSFFKPTSINDRYKECCDRMIFLLEKHYKPERNHDFVRKRFVEYYQLYLIGTEVIDDSYNINFGKPASMSGNFTAL